MTFANTNFSIEEFLLRTDYMNDKEREILDKKYLKTDLTIAAIALICLAGGLASIILGISHNTSLSLGLGIGLGTIPFSLGAAAIMTLFKMRGPSMDFFG